MPPNRWVTFPTYTKCTPGIAGTCRSHYVPSWTIMDRIAPQLSISWCRPEREALTVTMAHRGLELFRNSRSLINFNLGKAELQYKTCKIMPAPFRNRDVNHLFTPEPSSWSKQALPMSSTAGRTLEKVRSSMVSASWDCQNSLYFRSTTFEFMTIRVAFSLTRSY